MECHGVWALFHLCIENKDDPAPVPTLLPDGMCEFHTLLERERDMDTLAQRTFLTLFQDYYYTYPWEALFCT